MAARSDTAPARWRRPFLIWLNGVDAGWTIPVLLLGFVAIWMVYLQVAYLSGDLHPDVLETWSLGRTFAWGSSKHPPLMGWVARAWTSVFPLSDWSFHLMAMTNSAAALWAVDLISCRFVRGDKRIVVLLLLMLLPTYQFQAQRFNANAVLLAVWPLATYCFLRSFETRRWPWAAAAGASAALAMLGKYYSVFLLGSFAFSALCHPQRRLYFTSLAPWVSIAVGLIVLLPHLHWLATTGAMPFSYAIAAHAGRTFDSSLSEALFFILGLAANMAIPAATWVMIAGYRLRRFPHDARMSSGLRLLFLIAIGTIVFPVLTGIVLGTDVTPLWAVQGLFLFVILVVGGARYPIERFYSVNLTVMVLGIAVIATVIAAPIHAAYRNNYPFEEGRNFYRAASLELTRLWHEHSSEPLPAIDGDENLVLAVAFYSPDHPVPTTASFHKCLGTTCQATPEKGWAAMCFYGDVACNEAMSRTASVVTGAIQTEFVAQSMLLGWPGATRRINAFVVPPYRPEQH